MREALYLRIGSRENWRACTKGGWYEKGILQRFYEGDLGVLRCQDGVQEEPPKEKEKEPAVESEINAEYAASKFLQKNGF